MNQNSLNSFIVGFLLLNFLSLTQSSTVSMFYCGFGGDFCGQSKQDDVNEKTDIIILAFANTQINGSLIVD